MYMDKQIIYYYQRGVASYLIAKKFGVSNSYVRELLKRKGVKVRGHNITNKMSAARRTPEENKQITAAASASNRGSIHTASHRSKLALSRQKKPKIDPVYERPLIDYCKEHDIEVIPQKAFYKYNVDLYLSRQNVVIEIFGGGFHNKKQAVDLFNNKIRYLSRKQIPVVIVWADKNNYNPEKIIDVAKFSKEPITIITGDGQPSVRGLKDIILEN